MATWAIRSRVIGPPPPDSVGIDTVTRFRREAPDTAIVASGGLNDASTAMNALRVGAQDYLVKGMLNSYVLERTIRHAIERNRLRTALQTSEAQMRQIVGAQRRRHGGRRPVGGNTVSQSCCLHDVQFDRRRFRLAALAVPQRPGNWPGSTSSARREMSPRRGTGCAPDATHNIASLRCIRSYTPKSSLPITSVFWRPLGKTSERLLWMDSLEAGFTKIVLEGAGTSIAASRAYVMEDSLASQRTKPPENTLMGCPRLCAPS